MNQYFLVWVAFCMAVGALFNGWDGALIGATGAVLITTLEDLIGRRK